MKFFILMLFSFLVTIYSGVFGADIKKELDLNRDGKIDRIETYKDNQLMAVERDSHFFGRMDEWITYHVYINAKTPTKIIKKDTNRDGKIDRIERYYSNPVLNIMIVTTEVDTLGSGKFDKQWTSTSKLNQEMEANTCPQNHQLENLSILKLNSDVGKINYSLKGRYHQVDWGYRIHQSCLDKWGKGFPQFLKDTMRDGFQCLSRLADDNVKNNPHKPNGAFENLKGFDNLLSKGNVSIVCQEKNYHWKTAAAHASSEPTEVLEELGIKAPFISLSPRYPAINLKPTKDESEELSKTLFHEQFHNLGFRHEDNIEFSYTCEICCFKKAKTADDKKEKEDTCRICAGAYTGLNDKQYISDLINWDEERAQKAILKYELEFPRDRFGIFAYTKATADIFEPVGIELGKILRVKFSNLTVEEKEILNFAGLYADQKNIKKVSKYSQLVALAHFNYYFEQDIKGALSLMEKNIALIQELVKTEKKVKGNDKYIFNDIKNKLMDLISQIQMNGYPDNDTPESMRAFKLSRIFK